jgi:cysteine desulfurase
LAARLVHAVPDVMLHVEHAMHAPHILSISVPGAESEALLMHLDMAGIACSGGSACSAGAIEPSHVLMAMGIERSLSLGTIRFSLGHETTADDVERVASAFPGIVDRVRQLHMALGRV